MPENRPEISIVVAMDEKRGIGKDGKIPWPRIPEDLQRLKNLTLGHVTIVGRTSYESMLGYYEASGRDTMSRRTHVVVSRNPDYQVDPGYGFAASSIEEALEKAKQEEVFVIGGAQIYAQTLVHATRLLLTMVEGNYKCDTFFPDYSVFDQVVSETPRESNGLRYKFLELARSTRNS